MSRQPKARVLIVEDESLVSAMIKSCLIETGYEVANEVANGRDALDAVQKSPPDIILMDIHLPDIDGLEIAAKINSLRQLPIVILTAYDTPDLLDRAKNIGVLAYLVKPPNTAEIDRALQLALARHRDLEDLRVANENLKQEISERKWAEKQNLALQEKLQHAQKFESLGLLAGGMARDFNNMLMVILGNVELCLLENSSGRTIQPMLEDIRKAGFRATDLTAQLLAFAGGYKPAESPTDINSLVSEIISLLQISKKASLLFRSAANLPRITCDPSQLRQALANIMTNAHESGSDKPLQIKINTGIERLERSFLSQHEFNTKLAAGDYIYVQIIDNGAGFNAETARKIFDPFFTTKGFARGLGLAVALGVARTHLGTIHVQSELGKGTNVKFYLPCPGTVEAQPEEPSETTQASAATLKQATAQPTLAAAKRLVLIIDDENTVRAVSQKLLEAVGFRTLTASNGLAGVELFKENKSEISAVLLDVCMPGIDGLQTHALIREISKDTPVMFFSGYSDQEVAPVLTADPRAGFLKKPFRPTILVQKLEELIRSRA